MLHPNRCLLKLPPKLPLRQPSIEVIDEWRRKQPDLPSRPEAIRRLVELGLKGKR